MSAGERIRVVEVARPADLPPHPGALLRLLGGPAVLRVPGRDRTRTRAVATLIHGNEPSGLRAVHARLRSGPIPAVNAVIFIGAVAAALEPPGFAHRVLPGHRDLNRCFLPPYQGQEGEIAGEALRLLRESNPEALIDLHNNTGHNPPYGVAPVVGAAHLNLAALFGERFVHSTLRLGALVEATDGDFPSVTIECGRAGTSAADRAARLGLDRYLDAEWIDARHVTAERMQVLVDPVRVRVRPGVRLAFGDRPEPEADLTVAGDIDRHNFELLMPGAPIGWIGPRGGWPLEAAGADGRDVSEEFFAVRDGILELRRGAVPIMMTTDPRVATSDCLFYAVRPGEEIRATSPASPRA